MNCKSIYFTVSLFLVLLCSGGSLAAKDDSLPTLYEYYTGDGISSGLSDAQPYFTLNGKNITIYSGTMHYFRVHRAYWRDRLRKIRAAGLNTVETYVPWNLHEYQNGVFDFGSGSSEMEDFLHLNEFLEIAKEEDLFVLLRPGPYICAEWEFGGLPSWLLRTTTSVRNSKDQDYLFYVQRYFRVLLPILADRQFQNNGPIIGFQVENEYGNTGEDDVEYLVLLRQMFLDNGIVELLFTSDSTSNNARGAIPGILQTANFNSNPRYELDQLNALQTNKPTMAMEFWTGWYDIVLESHHNVSLVVFKEFLEEILDYPASVNLYTFIGSTNFGFLNGATTIYSGSNNSGLQPVTTSYDYDAPITEYGHYTDKYTVVKEAIAARNPVTTKTPDPPEVTATKAYPTLELENQLYFSTYVDINVDDVFPSEDIIPMELLPMNNNSGQSFGYILYRKTNLSIPANPVLKISGYVRDTVMVMLNDVLVSGSPKDKSDMDDFGFWRLANSTLILSGEDLEGATLELLVENYGRNNFGDLSQFRQFKGLTDPVYINEEKLTGWEIVPVEFKKSKNAHLIGWLDGIGNRTKSPALYRSTLTITNEPQDTFLDMRDWNKGIAIVNDFVVGRYFFLGPQQTLYIPAPLLIAGANNIMIFEHYAGADSIKFSDKPIFGKASH